MMLTSISEPKKLADKIILIFWLISPDWGSDAHVRLILKKYPDVTWTWKMKQGRQVKTYKVKIPTIAFSLMIKIYRSKRYQKKVSAFWREIWPFVGVQKREVGAKTFLMKFGRLISHHNFEMKNFDTTQGENYGRIIEDFGRL